MKKLKLKLQDIRVESFVMNASKQEKEGTIKGFRESEDYVNFGCTGDIGCQATGSMETCFTCPETCQLTCRNTCGITCPNTCADTCQTCGATCPDTCADTCGPTCIYSCGWTCFTCPPVC